MMSGKMQEAINKQINAELYSGYLYLSMAAQFDSMSFPGFAHWMRSQAQEELFHAMKFFDYVCERGGVATLQAIEGPPTEWESPLAMFEAAYEHEQKVTGMINDLVDLAIEEKDHASNNFLQWYVAEQVEEEASADEVVQKLKLAGSEGGGLFMLDREMGQRAPLFTFPTGESEGGE